MSSRDWLLHFSKKNWKSEVTMDEKFWILGFHFYPYPCFIIFTHSLCFVLISPSLFSLLSPLPPCRPSISFSPSCVHGLWRFRCICSLLVACVFGVQNGRFHSPRSFDEQGKFVVPFAHFVFAYFVLRSFVCPFCYLRFRFSFLVPSTPKVNLFFVFRMSKGKMGFPFYLMCL